MSVYDAVGCGSVPQTGDVTFRFERLPESLEDLQAMPEAKLQTPFEAAALTVCALCVYAALPETGIGMLNYLKGPQPLSPYQLQFLRDRFRDKTYVPFSYFDGAVPANDYTPSVPYSITVKTTPYSYQSAGYCTLYVHSGGADNDRSVQLRQKGDQWFLWEQFLLSDIRTPASKNPWA